MNLSSSIAISGQNRSKIPLICIFGQHKWNGIFVLQSHKHLVPNNKSTIVQYLPLLQSVFTGTELVSPAHKHPAPRKHSPIPKSPVTVTKPCCKSCSASSFKPWIIGAFVVVIYVQSTSAKTHYRLIDARPLYKKSQCTPSNSPGASYHIVKL